MLAIKVNFFYFKLYFRNFYNLYLVEEKDVEEKHVEEKEEINVELTEEEDEDDQLIDVEDVNEEIKQDNVNHKRRNNLNKIQCLSTN
jgi:hypothetical protein